MLIISPKMPANPPRSTCENHAAFILTMPGAPKACVYPSNERMTTSHISTVVIGPAAL